MPELAQRKARATIRDVALRSGVSIATVSRVFNHSESVDESTRLRVLEAARALHYVPNQIGRSLSTKKTSAIGLLLPDLFGEFFSEVIRGADETAQNNQYHLLVSSSHSNRGEIESALRMMRGRVDGLVIMSPHINAQSLNENLPHDLPVTLLNCFVEGDAFDSLNIDNYGGAYQMVKHLLGHGHRRVAIIKGTEENFDARERLRGYREALEAGGAAVDPRYEFPGDFRESTGFDAVRALLALPDRPTAVFASNDSMAIGALSGLRRAGVRVPEDIALAGFDDIPVCAYLTPALTSVHVSVDQLGVQAVQTLLGALGGNSAHGPRQRILETTSSIRRSCGCTQQP